MHFGVWKTTAKTPRHPIPLLGPNWVATDSAVANASTESRLPYFRGKGKVEEILKRSGLSYAIIRPTLVFGEGDHRTPSAPTTTGATTKPWAT